MSFEINISITEFETMLKWISHVKAPTKKELDLVNKVRFIIENMKIELDLYKDD